MSRELSCKELVELVTDYLEGALTAPERRRFEDHLGECDGCVGYVESIRKAIRIVGRFDEGDLPADLERELAVAFRGWTRA